MDHSFTKTSQSESRQRRLEGRNFQENMARLRRRKRSVSKQGIPHLRFDSPRSRNTFFCKETRRSSAGQVTRNSTTMPGLRIITQPLARSMRESQTTTKPCLRLRKPRQEQEALQHHPTGSFLWVSMKGRSEERSGEGRWCSTFSGAHNSQQQCPVTMYTIKTPRSMSRLLKLRDGALCMNPFFP